MLAQVRFARAPVPHYWEKTPTLKHHKHNNLPNRAFSDRCEIGKQKNIEGFLTGVLFPHSFFKVTNHTPHIGGNIQQQFMSLCSTRTLQVDNSKQKGTDVRMSRENEPTKVEGEVVKWFTTFGFVKPKEGNEGLFFHISDIKDNKPVAVGDKVSFEIATTIQGKYQGKPKAAQVQLLKPSMQSISDSSNGTTVESKPLMEWSENEIQNWILSTKYANHAQASKHLNGKELAGLSKEDFLRRCPEMGDVIYNAVQELKGEKDKTTSVFGPMIKKSGAQN